MRLYENFKKGLEILTEVHGVRAIFMGTRNTDAWCRKLTDRTVEQLMEKCKSLKTFNITALEKITSDAISALKGTNKLVHVVSQELANHASESSVSSVESPTSARN